MKKIILLCLITFSSSIFADGMGPGAGILGQDGNSLVPVRLDCFYHNIELGVPITLYESHTILYTHQVNMCRKDVSFLVSMGVLSTEQAEQEIAQDPECYTHTTNAQ